MSTLQLEVREVFLDLHYTSATFLSYEHMLISFHRWHVAYLVNHFNHAEFLGFRFLCNNSNYLVLSTSYVNYEVHFII
jgi:hypothetical protein